MEIDQLRTLLAVLEHGSFTRAAEAMHASQSTVSFHVRALEDVVGTRLLERRRGGARATAAGRVLARYAARIVTLRAEALARFQSESRGESGRLGLTASTIPAEHLLPPALAVLRRTHPGVTIELVVSDSEGALAAVLSRDCDLALVGTRVADRRIAYTAFAQDEVVLVAAIGGPGGDRREMTLRDLRRLPIVVRPEGSGTRAAVAGILARLAADTRAAWVEVGSNEAVRRCVLAGLGVSFVSRRSVADEIESGKLRVVGLAGTPVLRSFYVARLRGAAPSAAAGTLVRILTRGEGAPRRASAPDR